MTVRTRFAPSPTGYLHIGGARTALFNYLFAKNHGGEFILRVEDTDLERSTEESIQAILDGMEWLGLTPDEGPYFQSKCRDHHVEAAERLLDDGKAYRCYCTPDELQARRAEAMEKGLPPRYDGRCRNIIEDAGSPEKAGIDPDRPAAVRFKVDPGETVVTDLLRGNVSFDNDTIEDFVILRGDGTPTYNISVVVDDATMKVSHIIRGDDHLNNTPKQQLIYEALGYEVPEFAHIPMILGTDKARLSKRHGATSVIAYKDMGYMPEALVNYLARLGWSFGDEEVFSMEELVEKFGLENVSKSAGVFNPEKLLWLSQHYVMESKPEDLLPLLTTFFDEYLPGRREAVTGHPHILGIIESLQPRSKDLRELASGATFFFTEGKVTYDEKAARKFLKAGNLDLLEVLIEGLKDLSDFKAEPLETFVKGVAEDREMKLGKVAQPIRVALTGTTVSPGIFETLEMIGKEKALERLRQARDYVAKLPEAE